MTLVLSGSTLLSRMSNPAPSDNVVLRHAVEQIQRCLPGHWSTSVTLKTNDAADARLTIKTPAGASAALAIGARRQLDPRLVAEVAGALKTAAADAFVVIAPFLGPRTRERLADEGLGYVDLVGNMRLRAGPPDGVHRVARRGQQPVGGAADRAVAARGQGQPADPGAGATGEGRGPRRCGVRQLAALAGTDPGYVSRLLDLFHREELIERVPRGPVVAVHAARLIRRWAEDYRFGDAHRFVAVAHAHGVPGALAALRDAGRPARAHGARRRGGADGDGAAGDRRRLRRQSRARRGRDRRRARGQRREPAAHRSLRRLRVRRDLGGLRAALRGARADHRRPARQPRARARAGRELARGDGGARGALPRIQLSAASA